MKTMRLMGTMMLGLFLLAGSSMYAQDSKNKEADRKAAQGKEMLAKKEMLEKQHQDMKEQEALMRVHEIEFVEHSGKRVFTIKSYCKQHRR